MKGSISINNQAHDEIPTLLTHVTVPGCLSYDLLTFKLGCPFLSLQLQSTGVYAPCETALMCQLIAPGDTVLDIGANIGYFTVLASKLVGPKGRVFAFEPEAKNFHVLTQNVDQLRQDNIFCSRLGVSDAVGSSILYLCQDNPGGHHFHQPPRGWEADTQNIQTTSIDLFLANQSGGVHFIKIDAQGWEPSIIRGMENTLSQNRDKAIVLFEFAPRALEAGPGGLDAAISLLEDQFTDFLFINETSMQVSEISAENISMLGKQGMESPDGAYASLLGFADPAAYQTARRRIG